MTITLFLKISLFILVPFYFDFGFGSAPISQAKSERGKVPLGLICEHKSYATELGFKLGVVYPKNRTKFDFVLNVAMINTKDTYKISGLTCNQFVHGVIAMIGAVSSDSFSTIHSYVNAFRMPLVIPWYPKKIQPPSIRYPDYVMSVRPDYHKAIIDTILHYEWKDIIFIYDSSNGLELLNHLHHYRRPGKTNFNILYTTKITSANEAIEFLGDIEKIDRWTIKHVVLDATANLTKDIIIQHSRDLELGNRNYHYLFSALILDEGWQYQVMEFRTINITGFRLLDPASKVVQEVSQMNDVDGKEISAATALMFDAVQIIVDTTVRLINQKSSPLQPQNLRKMINASSILNCYPRPNDSVTYFEHGENIANLIRQTHIEGLSGTITFDAKGNRLNFVLALMENLPTGDMVKIGEWSEKNGIILKRPKQAPLDLTGIFNRNKTYHVTTIEEPPYMMQIQSGTTKSDNIPHKGFCYDLALMIAEKLDITLKFHTVKDKRYGNENYRSKGGWDGMIGELVRKDMDMAIGPLVITEERQNVIDFSRPFLSFNFKEATAEEKRAAHFSFLQPLSTGLWLSILGSVVGVSVTVLMVSKLSPQEWRLEPMADEPENVTRIIHTCRFNLCVSIWFTICSFFQQSSEVRPRSPAGRIVTTFWWCFVFGIISTYTANMAAYLTLNKIKPPDLTYHNLASCPQDNMDNPLKYKPKFPNEIHGNDEGWLTSSVNVPGDIKSTCEMIVSDSARGIKYFGVGFPKGSILRESVNLAIMSLKEDGVINKLMLKWFEKTQCELPDVRLAGSEINLNDMSGLFYTLLAGLAISILVAVANNMTQAGCKKLCRNNAPFSSDRRENTPQQYIPEVPPPARHRDNDERVHRWAEEVENADDFNRFYSPSDRAGEDIEMQVHRGQV